MKYTLFSLSLVIYSINASQEAAGLEKLDAYLQGQKNDKNYNLYKIGKYRYYSAQTEASSFPANFDLIAYDPSSMHLWKEGWSNELERLRQTSAKLVRWNRPSYDCTSFNQQKPDIKLINMPSAWLSYIVQPAQLGQPGFFTIKKLTECHGNWNQLPSQDTVEVYQRTEHKNWEDRHWFTVDAMEGDVPETATVDYKARDAHHFTSVEVTVTKHEPINRKKIGTRCNKSTYASLVLCAAFGGLVCTLFALDYSGKK